MRNIKNIHFIGIGGSGMSGIAEVLLAKGYNVTGSDKNTNSNISRLQKLGAIIFHNHDAVNVKQADVVVVSSAIQENNIEIQTAKNLHIPIIPRAQMLAELMRFYQGIAIAGTHGKTTTTSLTASVLSADNLDPTFVIGGLLNSVGSNAYLGKSNYFVVEADESDASFLYLMPTISVITNIDADHMQTYDNDINKLKKAFIDFTQRLPFYGVAIVCSDDLGVQSILPHLHRRVITYGFNENADIQAINFYQNGWKSQFSVRSRYLNNCQPIDITLNLPGKHNVLNALASIGVAIELGINAQSIQNALASFGGVGRRMQQHGTIKLPCGSAILIDDYGHHPQEIQATIDALRQTWPEKRLILAFQPHRYSRTRDLFNDFVQVLSKIDVLLLIDIYSAGEQPISGISSENLIQSIQNNSEISPIFVANIDNLPSIIAEHVGINDNDVLILQGAGSIGTMPQKLMELFS